MSEGAREPEIIPPRPPKVAAHYTYWNNPPPSQSPRCSWWLSRIAAGWTPNRRIRTMGYDESSEWYGVYIWEYLNRICPALVEQEILQRR